MPFLCTRNGAQPLCGFYIVIFALLLEAGTGSIPILQVGRTAPGAQGGEAGCLGAHSRGRVAVSLKLWSVGLSPEA